MVQHMPIRGLDCDSSSIEFGVTWDCFSVDVEISRSEVEKCETPSHEAIVGSVLLFLDF